MRQPFPIVGILLCGFVIGLVPTLADGLRGLIGRRLHLAERRAEQLGSVFYLLWLPGMPLVGWLVDRGADSQQTLFYGLLGIVVAVAWLALAQTVGSVLGSLVLLGLAYSAVTTVAVLAMPQVLNVGPTPVDALNLGFVPVGLGALLGPWFVARIDHRWGYRQGLITLGLSVLLPAALVVVSGHDAFPHPPTASSGSGLLHNPQLGLITLALLFYFLIENCLDVWPTPYLQDLGYSGRGVRIGLAGFWSAFLAARLAVGIFGPARADAWILFCLALGAAFALGHLMGTRGRRLGIVGFCAVGACYGPLLPGALALVPEFCPELPATALGSLLALSGLDTLLFRPLLVRYAQKHPARDVMLVPTLVSLFLAAPLLVLALIRG